MAKIVKFPVGGNTKLGYKKVRRRKRVNLEDYGQLNMFTAPPSEARVVDMHAYESPFEQALMLDEEDSDKAAEYYWKAIKAGECVADAYCNLGIIESGSHRYIKAIDCFTNCLKYDPRHFEAHYNLANVYSEVGEVKLAKLHYQIAIEIEPEFESSYYNLALVLATDKNFKEAVKTLNHYKELVSDRDASHVDKLIQSLERSMKTKAN